MQHQIFIISDGTGRTADQALKAALTQFEDSKVQTSIRSNIRTKDQVLEIISEAKKVNGLVLHTVVSKKLRDIILDQGRLNDVETIDLMGPLLAQLSHHLSYVPAEKPGIFHELNKSYFQRIETVEFTFRHDDGQKIDELGKAEIILLGVSRTFKTPVSLYLAYKGWFVANVPIILEMPLAEKIYQLPPERVFCLTTFPNNLAELRKIRDRHLGGATGDYAQISYVQKELDYAEALCKNQPKWTIVNVTNKSIEEISSEILGKLSKKK